MPIPIAVNLVLVSRFGTSSDKAYNGPQRVAVIVLMIRQNESVQQHNKSRKPIPTALITTYNTS